MNICMSKKNQYPDLAEEIYSSSSMDELWMNYIASLRKRGSMETVLYANKLEEFFDMKETKKLILLEQEFYSLKEHMRDLKSELKVNFALTRRLKDFIGINEKIRLYLRKGKPLERVRDLLGFRIVLCSMPKDTMQSIKAAYQVMNKIIEFFVKERNCIVAEAEPVLSSGFDAKSNPDIIVPTRSYIMEGFENNLKDYIKHPKKKGYQGLHVIIKRPDGLVFEIQVRTMAMDVRAEHGTASHGPYKNDRYEGENILVDFAKVHMPGFVFVRNNIVCDNIGLCKSIDPFNLI